MGVQSRNFFSVLSVLYKKHLQGAGILSVKIPGCLVVVKGQAVCWAVLGEDGHDLRLLFVSPVFESTFLVLLQFS